MYFNSNHSTVWVEKSKIGFQDGGYGDHFGFPIQNGFIYTSACCNIVSVNLIRLLAYEKMSKTDFQYGGLWRPSWISDRHDFTSFRARCFPVPTEQVSVQIDQSFGKRCRKFSRWRLHWRHLRFSIGSSIIAILCLLGTTMLLIKFQLSWIIVFKGKYEFSTFSHTYMYRAHTNAGQSKFDLAVKRSNINVGPSF